MCVSVCVHVCPSFHAGQQRESWKFVISFLFPLLHSLLHCCTLPPLSSIWNTTHAHTHSHAQSTPKEFDKLFHANTNKEKCHAGCNSLNSAANTPLCRDSGSYATCSIRSYNLHIHSNLFVCCLECRVFGPFECQVDCEVSMMKQAHTERL